MRKKLNLQNKYPLILLWVLCLIAVFFGWFGYRLVENAKQTVINSMDLELARIERSFFDTIEYTSSLINAINIRISQDPYNKKHIANILTTYNDDQNLNKTMAWTLFSWIDSNAKLIVDAKYGILEKPIDCSIYEYVSRSERQTKIFHLGSTEIGATSKKFIIPGAMGLSDKNGKYLGSTAIGFEINRLARILYNAVKDPNINFKMLSQNGVTILNGSFQSFQTNINSLENDIKDEYIAKIINDLNSKNIKKYTEITIFRNSHAFLIKKSNNYPFFFILTYNKNSIKKELAMSLMNSLSEALSIILSCALLIFLIYREISQTKKSLRLKMIAQRANKSKLEFLIKAAHEFKNFIFAIHGCAEIIKDDLKKIKDLASKDKNFEKLKKDHDIALDIDLTKDIIEASHDLDNFINELIDLNYDKNNNLQIHPSLAPINVAQIIKNCASQLSRRARSSDIMLFCDVEDDLHKVEKLDVKILKQIITSLISHSIKHSKPESLIKISAINIDDEKTLQNIYKIHGIKKTKAVEITIRDQGFGINQKEIKSALQRISSFNKLDILTMRLPNIKFLIEKQGGIFEIRSDINNGNEFKIIL